MGLERAVVDLVRVGVGGHAAGVRQLAARLLRALPPGVSDPEGFRSAVHEAMAASGTATALRFSSGSIPADRESNHPLADVEEHPDGGGLVLPERVHRSLAEIVTERRRRDDLARAGLSVSRSVLLTGPPGVGKTMAARWFAEQLELPLVRVDLSTLVSSYLGTSGRNIRSILSFAAERPCVLLFDEFDAVAKTRDDPSEIGELKRIVNVVLTELDRWPDTSLLVAATNHPHLLDPAVGRRFDRAVTLPLPDRRQRRELLAVLHRAAIEGAHGPTVDALNRGESVLEVIAELADGASGSDLVQVWNHARRAAVLHEEEIGDALVDELVRLLCGSVEELEGRSHTGSTLSAGPARDQLWELLATRLGWSHRRIATRFKVSHPTVGTAVRRAARRVA